jgi:hypothetical protein
MNYDWNDGFKARTGKSSAANNAKNAKQNNTSLLEGTEAALQ